MNLFNDSLFFLKDAFSFKIVSIVFKNTLIIGVLFDTLVTDTGPLIKSYVRYHFEDNKRIGLIINLKFLLITYVFYLLCII